MSEEIKEDDDGEVLEPVKKVDNGFASVGSAALEAMIVHCPIDFVLQFLLDQWYQPIRLHAIYHLEITEQESADKKLLSGWHRRKLMHPQWLTEEMLEDHKVACHGLAQTIKAIEIARVVRKARAAQKDEQ